MPTLSKRSFFKMNVKNPNPIAKTEEYKITHKTIAL